MCDFGPGGLSSGRSPDRLDALVWALTHLMLAPEGGAAGAGDVTPQSSLGAGRRCPEFHDERSCLSECSGQPEMTAGYAAIHSRSKSGLHVSTSARLRGFAAPRSEALARRAADRLLRGRAAPCGRRATTRRSPARAFRRTPVVHRAVRLVAEAAASLPLTLLRAGAGARRASAARAARAGRIRARAGSAFCESALRAPAGRPATPMSRRRASTARRASSMRCGPTGCASCPGRTAGRRPTSTRSARETVRYADRRRGGWPPILHLTLFHPTDDHYGLSPMEAAAVALDIHNAAGAWNKALLDNAARPSGALVCGDGRRSLTEAQFDAAEARARRRTTRAHRNAGRPLLLEGGLDWQPLSLSPKDMDFVEAKAAAAREIALAFGVPPLLLGLPGDNTHANYAEANRAFYRQTVIPLVRRTARGDRALALARLRRDGLSARARPRRHRGAGDERESLWRRVAAADFLSADEKREAVGYGRGAPRRCRVQEGARARLARRLRRSAAGRAGEPKRGAGRHRLPTSAVRSRRSPHPDCRRRPPLRPLPASGERRERRSIAIAYPTRPRARRTRMSRPWRRRRISRLPCSGRAGRSRFVRSSTLRELSAANRRFDDFVRELTQFNRRHESEESAHEAQTSQSGAAAETAPASATKVIRVSRARSSASRAREPQ